MFGEINITSEFLVSVEELVTSDVFVQFLLSHTADLMEAAFVLQTVTDKIEEYRNALNEEN